MLVGGHTTCADLVTQTGVQRASYTAQNIYPTLPQAGAHIQACSWPLRAQHEWEAGPHRDTVQADNIVEVARLRHLGRPRREDLDVLPANAVIITQRRVGDLQHAVPVCAAMRLGALCFCFSVNCKVLGDQWWVTGTGCGKCSEASIATA